ncbi:hypothetical protein VTH06DRAFT_7734 [Thermothelomyces fergusii]
MALDIERRESKRPPTRVCEQGSQRRTGTASDGPVHRETDLAFGQLDVRGTSLNFLTRWQNPSPRLHSALAETQMDWVIRICEIDSRPLQGCTIPSEDRTLQRQSVCDKSVIALRRSSAASV